MVEDSFIFCGCGSLDIKTVPLDTVGVTQIETISLKTITVFFLFPLLPISLHYSFSGLSFPELFLSLAIPLFYFLCFSRQLGTAQCHRISCSLCQSSENFYNCSKTTDGCLSSGWWFLLFCPF